MRACRRETGGGRRVRHTPLDRSRAQFPQLALGQKPPVSHSPEFPQLALGQKPGTAVAACGHGRPANGAQQQMYNGASGCCKQFGAVSGSFLRASPGGVRPPGPPPRSASGARRRLSLIHI
eukprot:10766339-Alexandrium_andersonii.AAC.1